MLDRTLNSYPLKSESVCRVREKRGTDEGRRQGGGGGRERVKRRKERETTSLLLSDRPDCSK